MSFRRKQFDLLVQYIEDDIDLLKTWTYREIRCVITVKQKACLKLPDLHVVEYKNKKNTKEKYSIL